MDTAYNASVGAPKAFVKNTLELIQAQALPGFLGQMFLPTSIFPWLESHLGSALPGILGGTNYLAAGVLGAVLGNAHLNTIKKLEKAFNVDEETAILLLKGQFSVEDNGNLYATHGRVLQFYTSYLNHQDDYPITLQFLIEKLEAVTSQDARGLKYDVEKLLKDDRANFEKFFVNKLRMNPTYGPILLNGLLRLGVAVGSSYLLTPVLTAAISNAAIAGFTANMASQVASSVAVNSLRIVLAATQSGAKIVATPEDERRLLDENVHAAEGSPLASPRLAGDQPAYPDGVLPLAPPPRGEGFPQAQAAFLETIKNSLAALPDAAASNGVARSPAELPSIENS